MDTNQLQDLLLDALNDINNGIQPEEVLSKFVKTDDVIAELNMEADNLHDLFNMTSEEMEAEFGMIVEEMQGKEVNSIPTFVNFCKNLSKRQMLILFTKMVMDIMSSKFDNLKKMLEEKLSSANFSVNKKSILDKLELLEERFSDEIENDKLTKKIFKQLKEELNNEQSED